MGTHHLLDLYGVDPLLLSDLECFINFIRSTLEDNLAGIVGETHYKFPGDQSGYTSLFLLSSSHFSIHTWPERTEAAVDIFTCGGILAEHITGSVVKFFAPAEYNVRVIKR